jgi:dGTPase
LEVASIARTIARVLRLNEDLVEALALVHDLGHPPFGHAGEDVLNQCLREQGGFNHNAQALRIVQLLEIRYPNFPGLNLSLEVLEGQRHRTRQKPAAEAPLLEVQVVDAADSIAYDAHDADDALQNGLLGPHELQSVPLWVMSTEQVQNRDGRLDGSHLRRAVVRRLIDIQVGDLLQSTISRLDRFRPSSVADVQTAGILVAPSDKMAEQKSDLESFLFKHVYHHPELLRRRSEGQEILLAMFETLVSNPAMLPPKFRERAAGAELSRAVADYLAGMTDRFAWETYGRLRGTNR